MTKKLIVSLTAIAALAAMAAFYIIVNSTERAYLITIKNECNVGFDIFGAVVRGDKESDDKHDVTSPHVEPGETKSFGFFYRAPTNDSVRFRISAVSKGAEARKIDITYKELLSMDQGHALLVIIKSEDAKPVYQFEFRNTGK